MDEYGIGHEGAFQKAVEFFIRACPGPHIAVKGLRVVAYQRIRGIPGLEDGASRTHRIDVTGARTGYIATVAEVAERLRCRPAYLSQSALRRGYSYSRASRWLRFCHGIALRTENVGADIAALRIGFSDPSGWTRFTRALIGKSPSQLPALPLEFWVRQAVEDVYLRARKLGRATESP